MTTATTSPTSPRGMENSPGSTMTREPATSSSMQACSYLVSFMGSAYCRTLAVDTPRGYGREMIADLKKRALHRSKILEGQMRGLEKMIENEDYCMDIITQSLAIQ